MLGWPIYLFCGVFIAGAFLFAFALCRVSGDCSRAEERRSEDYRQ